MQAKDNSLSIELALKHKAKDLKFKQVLPNGSMLGLFSKPSTTIIGPLRQKYGLSLVVTMLGEAEKPYSIGKECKKHSIEWHYIKIHGGGPRFIRSGAALLAKGVVSVLSLMQKKKEVVLIHCASGMHRTGVFAYSLLRTIGLDYKEAMAKINEIRDITFKYVGKERIQIADTKVLPQIEKLVEKGELERVPKKEEEKKKEEEDLTRRTKLLKAVISEIEKEQEEESVAKLKIKEEKEEAGGGIK